jgi:hypothetical protein
MIAYPWDGSPEPSLTVLGTAQESRPTVDYHLPLA